MAKIRRKTKGYVKPSLGILSRHMVWIRPSPNVVYVEVM